MLATCTIVVVFDLLAVRLTRQTANCRMTISDISITDINNIYQGDFILAKIEGTW